MTPPLGAWGLTGQPVPLPGGHRNAVLRVGQHVLKSTRRSEAAIGWLLPVARHAEVCGLKVPAPLRSSLNTFVVDGWICEPFCAGGPTPPKAIADKITHLHSTAADLPQRDGFASARDLLTAQSGGDIDLAEMPPDLVVQLRAAWSAISLETTHVHGDLNPNNILTDTDGTVTLIDWDEARRDHPLFDTATWSEAQTPIIKRAALAWEIACSWLLEPAHARMLASSFTSP
ncbi:phosphotransferase [uncultured Tateyamaria sp.]|uniref:phosphotransferase n=1 Tax=uncultured Tateyamaria sp. TaxID=455651 RepID=UPI002624C94A|nr:phosphotransferase [uncultured Tateyamaria sp.]